MIRAELQVVDTSNMFADHNGKVACCRTCIHGVPCEDAPAPMNRTCARVAQVPTIALPKCQSRTLYVADDFGCVQWEPKERIR